MTSYAAYDAGLPCKNPNCKSHGRPHPNCRCYGGMAEGGKVEPFCSKAQAHRPDCEYFAGGGLSGQEVPDDAIAEPAAEAAAVASPSPGQEVPDDAITPPASGSEVPDDALPAESAAEPEAQPPAAPMAGQEVPDDAVADWSNSYEGIKPFSKEAFQKAGTDLLRNAGWAVSLTPLGEGVTLAKGALQGAIGNGLITGSDEISNLLLGKGDPNDAVGAALAHTAISAGLGSLFGGIGSSVQKGLSSGLSKLAESGLGERLEYALYGLASAFKGEGAAGAAAEGLGKNAKAGLDLGNKIYGSLTSKILPPTLGATVEGYEGFKKDGITGGLSGVKSGLIHGVEADLIGAGVTKIGAKIAAPTILKVLSSGAVHGLGGAFDHAARIAGGMNLIDSAVGNLVRTSPVLTEKAIKSYGSEEDRDRLDKLIKESGGVLRGVSNAMQDQNTAQPQPYAHGGEVDAVPQPPVDGAALHYPEQSMLMGMAKGRISNYLNSLRPDDHEPRMAFDSAPDQTKKNRSYKKALDIANSPLGVLEEIRKGTVVPEHVQHFKALHPEMDSLLQRKMTEKITEMQLKGEKPPYHVRQGLSLFMGTPLSAEGMPANIRAAQATFAQKGAQPPPNQPPQSPKNTSKLSKSDQSFLTGSQAVAVRAQKS